jgi:broad specificity phosphatase PhoE
MSVVYLVRHGQASLRSSNYDQLSEKGILQAQMLGKSFRTRVEEIERFESGSLQRHAQTMAAFKEKYRTIASVSVHDGWNEYDHKDIIKQYNSKYDSRLYFTFDIVRKLNPKREFLNIFNAAVNRWMSGEFDAEYKESWTAFQTRTNKALHDLLAKLNEEEVAIVFTSGGVKSAIIQRLMDLTDDHFMRFNTQLVNSGVTKIISTKNRTFVSTINDYSHLELKRDFITYI